MTQKELEHHHFLAIIFYWIHGLVCGRSCEAGLLDMNFRNKIITVEILKNFAWTLSADNDAIRRQDVIYLQQ